MPPHLPLSSSLNIAAEGLWRHGPEYVHVRSRVDDDGTEVDLNTDPDVAETVAAEEYRARHYVDFTGDGWVAAVVPQLATVVPRRRAADSLVAAPDFFPSTDQRELMERAALRSWPVSRCRVDVRAGGRRA